MQLIGSKQKSLTQNQLEEKSLTPPEIKPKKHKQRASQLKKGVCTKRQSKNARTNHWNEFQQRRYIKFLQQSGHLMSLSFREKRNMKVNEMMSKRVKTRDASQCHSHHQKMLFTHSSIEEIIQNYLYLLQNEQKYFAPKKKRVQTSTNQFRDEIVRQQPNVPLQQIEEISKFISIDPHQNHETIQDISNGLDSLIQANESEEINPFDVKYQYLTSSHLSMMMDYSGRFEEESPKIIYLFQDGENIDWLSPV